ncbi:head completion/stabilization protein [Stenotrophomonas sp. B1-1]|uniref:head completion/stabilization protein n=1 Tax=Stenotrophomonas sp. B1-1 TaxID=2710648 RepID=UPI0013DCD9AB|nr:head completion/stabilization protein [Stenotrophomonas sp. B1-1]
MSSFVANGATAPAHDPISAGPFWPDIDVNALREAIRVPGDVLPARLRQTVLVALISVTRELDAWQAKQMAEGYATLDQVPARRIDGRSVLEHLFHRAVQCCTAVELHERYRSYDATAQGNQRADDLSPTIDEMRRDLRNAISDLLGTRRVTVELI